MNLKQKNRRDNYVRTMYNYTMVKRLQKIGNSSGLVIDRAILSLLKMDKDEEVEISIHGSGIMIIPTKSKRK